MPPPIQIFKRPALMRWDGNKITDHGRSALGVSFNRIETSQRMANGMLRKYFVADKREFDVSWKELPSTGPWTVDGFWGGKEMLEFWTSSLWAFTLQLSDGQEGTESYQVMFSSFDYDIEKRGATDLWSVSVTLEEV